MYHRYFGLTEPPFSIAVDPRYLFMSARHRDALAHLLYGVGAGGGFILLTGPVGTGKTTITRSLLEQLPDNTDLALVLNPSLNSLELLASICDELGISYRQDELQGKALTDKIHQHLVDNFARGRNTVLLIDEAQHLHFETLEQIRLLTNLETNTKKLLQIILVGQPELRSLLQKPELSQLAQRITARFQLSTLNLAETQAYIRHRLHIAGLPGNQNLFSPQIVKKIYQASKGTPRVINVLCDRMLLGCYGKNKTTIDKAIAQQAINEINDEEQASGPVASRWPWLKFSKALALVSLIIAAAVFAPQLQNRLTAPATSHTTNTLANAAISAAPAKTISWHQQDQAALQQLAKHLGLTVGDPVCGSNFRCEALRENNWAALAQYQRPVMLELSDGQQYYYANLIGLGQQQASLLTPQGETSLALSELAYLWTGNFTLLWQAPASYSGPIGLGEQGPLVQWLGQQFANLDQQSQPLSTQTFNRALYQRVILFQQSQGLTADGVVGLKTLLKLEQQLQPTTLLEGSF
ncbi:AAA family ATPase [Dasania sp. GY-MA-18]|uniref:AAA family ATPase n=1 Tax=Dasania phycosphaerae TaxID=2950436 RepID=A0A9J6RMH0_9GAMM|nr:MULTISPECIES: ExeA family protein [Dasania]MCR8923228.1 AAA family ATPase [Dasania sp. GY-MA-18]MCZ0865660.1 AAA family ATPase [Dasania phycosphaerae]MCZ0869385.1 AAA family ATPase [Dasania phycosphaerae]